MSDVELKDRPYRLGEVAWDIFPAFAVPILLHLLMGEDLYEIVGLAFPMMVLAFLLPLSSSVWMHISTGPTIVRLSRREWRESLCMTEIHAQPYIISVLKKRAVVQSFPFVLGLSFLGVSLCWLVIYDRDSFVMGFLGVRTLVPALAYAIFSAHLCGIAAGYWGMADRLRWLCRRQGASERFGLAMSKWILITTIIPLLVVGGGVYLMIATFEEEMDHIFPMICYLLAVCTTLNWIFLSGMRRSWRKAIDEYYQFE